MMLPFLILISLMISVLTALLAGYIFLRTAIYTIRYVGFWHMRRFIAIRVCLGLMFIAYSIGTVYVVLRSFLSS